MFKLFYLLKMILFKKDWAKYPGANIDLDTPNQSFVRICSIYQAFGVENHAFPLALIDQSLKGVDPFSPYLTPEQITRITIECKLNPWYYFREIARAPGMAGGGARPMEANRGNIGLFWLFFNHIFTTLIQIRQTGKSFSVDTLNNYLMNIGCTDTKINLLTKDDDLRRKNITRLKEIYSEMPVYLQQKTRADTNNNEEITIKALGNYYNTHVPQASEKNAIKMGRGLTSPIFHIDEPPFQPWISKALPAALAATGAAVDVAKASGGHYGTILTTTAGKRDDRDGKFIYDIVQGSAVWSEALFDCKDQEELEDTIRMMSRDKVCRVNLTLNHQQLGKTDKWLLEKLEESVQTGDDANRDYFNMWTAGGLSSPLPTSIVERISFSCREVVSTEIHKINRYTTRWYVGGDDFVERMINKPTILSMDTSEAIGKDDTAMLITDPESFETLGAGHYNETNIIVFAEWVADLFLRFPKMIGIIERKSTGSTLLDYLLVYLPQRGIDPFKRLFNTVVHNAVINKAAYDEIRQPMNRRDPDIYTKYKQTFGYNTSGSGPMARSVLYSELLLQSAVRSCDHIYDKKLIDQICSLEVRNGRVDHVKNGHDDMVVAWLLSHFLLARGNNLSYYGLDVTRVGMYGCDNDRVASVDSYMSSTEKREQSELKQKIDDAVQRLENSKDEFVAARLEQELRSLSYRVIAESSEAYNIETVIAMAREKRKQEKKNTLARPVGNNLNKYWGDKKVNSADVWGHGGFANDGFKGGMNDGWGKSRW